MRTHLLLLAMLAACSSKQEKACEAFSDRFAACNRSLPAAGLDHLYKYCAVALVHEPQPGDHPDNMAAILRTTFEQCTTETTCESIQACLDRRGCQFILTGPDDKVPELQCWAPKK